MFERNHHGNFKFRSAEKEFNSELGKEARSILKSYMYEKDKQ